MSFNPFDNLEDARREHPVERRTGMTPMNSLNRRAIDREAGKPIPTKRWPDPTEPEPSMDEIVEMEADGECTATDGCSIEPDGVCPHGHPSWLLRLGFI